MKIFRTGGCSLSVCIAIASVGAAYAQNIPPSPVWPSKDDCQRLYTQHHNIRMSAQDAMIECMRGPSRIGEGELVNWSTCETRNAIRAWPQCISAEVNSCRLDRATFAEQSVCQQRATARTEKEFAERSAELERTTLENAKRLGEINRLTAEFRETSSFLSDPRKFILRLGQEGLSKLIFPEGERPTSADRYDYADELYTFAQNSTDDVWKTSSRSPVVNAIQAEAFKHIFEVFKSTKNDLKQLNSQIGSFSFDPTAAPIFDAGPVQSQHPVRGEAADCAILDDVDRSNRLLATNESKWITLVEQCG